MDREYTDCYIAFLDLLGFKQKIANLPCEDIAAFFDEISTKYTITSDLTNSPIVNVDDIKYKVMSDSICVYIDSSIKNSLAGLIAICNYFQVRMLRLNVPCLVRGGIVQGSIYAQGDITFGKGLTDAYLLEEKVARFPRIILTKSTLESCKSHDAIAEDYIKKFVFCDFDRFYTLDYLYLFYGLNHDVKSWKDFAIHVRDVLDSETDISIREKYKYIEDSFHRVTKKYLQEITNDKAT